MLFDLLRIIESTGFAKRISGVVQSKLVPISSRLTKQLRRTIFRVEMLPGGKDEVWCLCVWLTDLYLSPVIFSMLSVSRGPAVIEYDQLMISFTKIRPFIPKT